MSVVVPVYNTAPYLAQCLDSILAQTWALWECVVVDNCSTDGSLEIARRYEGRDPRFRIVAADQFRSQAANFNYALGFIDAESVYTKMVLSDDWIFPDCLEEMVRVGEAYASIGVISAYMLTGSRVACQGLPYPGERVDGLELRRRHFLLGIQVFGSQTSVMYRSAVVRKLHPFFDESSLSNDREVCFRILRDYDFGFVHKILTFSRTDNESITSGIIGFNPYPLHSLILLRQYGREVLDATENAECVKAAEREYFHYLGEQALRGREPDFWAYHSRGLGLIGYELTSARRMGLAVSAFLDLLGNPKESVGRLLHNLARRRPSPT